MRERPQNPEFLMVATARLRKILASHRRVIENSTLPEEQVFHAYFLSKTRESLDFLEAMTQPEEMPGILRIGVDFDGIVCDFDPQFVRTIRRGLGVRIATGVPRPFFYEEYPEIQASGTKGLCFIQELCRHPWVYGAGKPVLGALEILSKWREEGHKICFITARPYHLMQITFKWLEENDLSWAKERFYFRRDIAEDRNEFKKNLALKRRLHLFIDDFAETLKVIDSPCLYQKILFARDWNSEANLDPKVMRFNHWQFIDEVVQRVRRKHFSENIPRLVKPNEPT